MKLVDDFKRWISENHSKIQRLGFDCSPSLERVLSAEVKKREKRSMEPDWSIDFSDKDSLKLGTVNIWLDGKVWITILKSRKRNWEYSQWHENVETIEELLKDFLVRLVATKFIKNQ